MFLSAQKRARLPLSVFGLPKARKFPMPDARHVRLAAEYLWNLRRAKRISMADYLKVEAKIRAREKHFGLSHYYVDRKGFARWKGQEEPVRRSEHRLSGGPSHPAEKPVCAHCGSRDLWQVPSRHAIGIQKYRCGACEKFTHIIVRRAPERVASSQHRRVFSEVDLFMAKGIVQHIRLYRPSAADLSHQLRLPMSKAKKILDLQKEASGKDEEWLVQEVARLVKGGRGRR